jgi:hypothetical protein
MERTLNQLSKWLRLFLVSIAISGPAFGQEEALSNMARKYRSSIVLIGNSKKGHGTGWILSSKHRLIVTNAHVADLVDLNQGAKQSFVTMNGNPRRIKIEKVWYHPGLIRTRGKPRHPLSISVR